METVVLLPIEDVGPNDGTESPPGPHYANLDDEPNDGDASYVILGFAGFKTVLRLDVSAIPEGSIVQALRIRWAAKAGASLATGRAGIRVDGTYYFAAPRAILGGYPAFDETVTHPDGNPWTKDRIAATPAALELFSIEDDAALPRPRFSELVGLADIIRPPDRPRAVGKGGPAAGVSSSSPGARAGSAAPAGAVSSAAPAATLKSTAPGAAAASIAPSSKAASGAPRAVTVEDLATVRVRVSSNAPRARVTSSSPQAEVTSSTPKGEGA